MAMRNIILRFDMRSSPRCKEDVASRYQAVIDMTRWADQQQVDVIGLSEHHNSPDGYLSSPLTLAGMIASHTERIRISVSALLVPLHDPIRLAEDIALLDLISKGRFSATAGLGYRELEYDTFQVNWKQRGKIFDNKLAIILKAFKGEPFDYQGTQVQLSPVPKSSAQSILLVGGNSKAAARRAARFGLMFSPAIDDQELELAYQNACKEYGFKYGFVIHPREPATTFISEDPEKSWHEIGEYLLFDASAYGAWRHPSRRAYAESFANTIEELKAEGKYRILTPEQAISVIEKTGSLHLAPLTGGIPSQIGWETLKLFEEKVQPRMTLN